MCTTVYKNIYTFAGTSDPFPIPMFKQDVEESRKKFADDDREYMCRVLTTVLQTYVQIKQREIVANA